MPDDIRTLTTDYDDFADGEPIPDFDPMDAPLPPPPEGITPLGHDRGVFYYLSSAGRQVRALRDSEHGPNTLMGLASMAHYWQRGRFVSDKGAVRWDEAKDYLMGECRRLGIFDPSRLRGRGAWIDGGRSILHVGDRLIIDGKPAPLQIQGSRFVYEAARQLGIFDAPALGNRDANQLVKICQRLRWERGIHGTLLAGWIAIAPICGGLAWRPSIWLTGGSGSGKSWVMENVVSRLLGSVALFVQSATSEAGIRHVLGSDALPVIFDEAEREDARSAERMQGVLSLVRQASSETGGAIIKGSQNQQGGKIYRIRSCFMFQSINVGIDHQADASRLTILSLRPPAAQTEDEAAAFDALNADVQTTITPEYAAALIARSVLLLLVIRQNAETFARAAALHLGSRRLGDQLGALLAGAYALHSEAAISLADAADWIKRQDWDMAEDSGDTEPDERRLLTHLTQSRLRVAPGNSAPIETTVGSMIAAAWGGDERIAADVAEGELRSIGIKTDARAGIFVSTNHPRLKSLLQGTPWSAGWGRALLRLPDTEAAKKPQRFGPMHNSRAVWVGRSTLEGEPP